MTIGELISQLTEIASEIGVNAQVKMDVAAMMTPVTNVEYVGGAGSDKEVVLK